MRKKIIVSLIVFLLAMLVVTTSVFALDGIDKDKLNQIYNNSNSTSSLLQKGGQVIYIVQLVGSGVGVISLMIIGVRYMFTSPEGKADFKKQMVPFVIGAILVFAASNLVAIVARFGIGIK